MSSQETPQARRQEPSNNEERSAAYGQELESALARVKELAVLAQQLALGAGHSEAARRYGQVFNQAAYAERHLGHARAEDSRAYRSHGDQGRG